MAKVRRYTKEMVDQYVKAGYWTRELTVDFWDRNASLYPDEEALVDSRNRLTWLQAKQRICGRRCRPVINSTLLGRRHPGFSPSGLAINHSVPQTAERAIEGGGSVKYERWARLFQASPWGDALTT